LYLFCILQQFCFFFQGTLAITLPDEVKAKLIEVLPLLNQGVGQLVQDVEPIRAIFKQIQNQLPRDLKAKMLQVAFIKNQQLIVQEAQNWLEESRRQEQLTQEKEKLDDSMADLDNRIEFLSSSLPDIVSNIDRLKKRRAELMKELDQVGQDLSTEEQKLADLPGTITTMQEQRDSFARLAQTLRSQEQSIPGSVDVDRQEIKAVDQLRLDLINAIQLVGIV
jgi:chromosome segregation ATPase